MLTPEDLLESGRVVQTEPAENEDDFPTIKNILAKHTVNIARYA